MLRFRWNTIMSEKFVEQHQGKIDDISRTDKKATRPPIALLA